MRGVCARVFLSSVVLLLLYRLLCFVCAALCFVCAFARFTIAISLLRGPGLVPNSLHKCHYLFCSSVKFARAIQCHGDAK